LPYCGLLFRCGCTWLWEGGIARCNIYDGATPNCPWCVAPPWAAWIPVWGTPTLMALAASALLWTQRGLQGTMRATAAALLLFFGVNFLITLGFRAATGYPYFVWTAPPPVTTTRALNASETNGSIPLTTSSHAHNH